MKTISTLLFLAIFSCSALATSKDYFTIKNCLPSSVTIKFFNIHDRLRLIPTAQGKIDHGGKSSSTFYCNSPSGCQALIIYQGIPHGGKVVKLYDHKLTLYLTSTGGKYSEAKLGIVKNKLLDCLLPIK